MADGSPLRRFARRLVASLLALSLSGLCIWAGLRPPDEGVQKKRKEALPPAVSACTADDDCLLVDRIGCCGCQASGAQWAINREQTDQLRRFIKHSCGLKAPCVQLDSCRSDLVPVCIKGQCALRIAPAGAELRSG